MADNWNEQELQALFRKHLPMKQMPQDFADQLKKQVLAEVAATLGADPVKSVAPEEASPLGAPVPERIVQPKAPRSVAVRSQLSWTEWLRERFRFTPSMVTAGAMLLVLLAFIVWSDRLPSPVTSTEGSVNVLPSSAPTETMVVTEAPIPTDAVAVAGVPSPEATPLLDTELTPTPTTASGDDASTPETQVVTAVPTVEPATANGDTPSSGDTNGSNPGNGSEPGTAREDAPFDSADTATPTRTATDDEKPVATASATRTPGVTPSPTDVPGVLVPTSTPTRVTATAVTATPTLDDGPARNGTATPEGTRRPTVVATLTPMALASVTVAVVGAPTNNPNSATTLTPFEPTNTPTPAPSYTVVLVPTSTPTPIGLTPWKSPTPTSTLIPAPTLTDTPLPTATDVLLPTATKPAASSTPIATATEIAESLPTATNTVAPTRTNTPVPTATNTVAPTRTNTPVPTATNTVAPTRTNTPVPTATNTPVPTATNTPLPTATNTLIPTATDTPLPTATNTLIPTATDTPLPTATPTATNTPWVNHPPVITSAPVVVVEDTPLSINLLNFVVDEDAHPLKITEVSGASHGAVYWSGGVDATYVPAPDFDGTDSFEFAVSDGFTTSRGSITITMMPVNDAPEIRSQAGQSATENVEYSYAIEVVDKDNPLTDLEFVVNDKPLWLQFEYVDAGRPRLYGTPSSSDVPGPHKVKIGVRDRSSDFVIQEFEITVTGNPVGGATPTADVGEGVDAADTGAPVSPLPTAEQEVPPSGGS